MLREDFGESPVALSAFFPHDRQYVVKREHHQYTCQKETKRPPEHEHQGVLGKQSIDHPKPHRHPRHCQQQPPPQPLPTLAAVIQNRLRQRLAEFPISRTSHADILPIPSGFSKREIPPPCKFGLPATLRATQKFLRFRLVMVGNSSSIRRRLKISA